MELFWLLAKSKCLLEKMPVGNYFSALDAKTQFWQVSKLLLCEALFMKNCHLGSAPERFKRKAKKLAYYMEDTVF